MTVWLCGWLAGLGLVAAQAANPGPDYARERQLLRSDQPREREQARQALEQAAASEPKEAGFLLGDGWARGWFGEKPDPAKACEWWTKSAEAGHAMAWYYLGGIYNGDFGEWQGVDAVKATDCFRKAAEADVKQAWLVLGARLLNGVGCTADEKEANRWLVDKAVADGNYQACLILGEHAQQVGDLAKASATFKIGAEQQHPACMFRYAVLLSNGQGTKEEQATANDWIEKAAAAGHPEANLARIDIEQQAEQPDETVIYDCLKRAAQAGHLFACQQLGLMYYRGGPGKVPDRYASAVWLDLAARAGLPQAQFVLASQLEVGDGTPRNLKEAFRLYTLAMEQGHPSATLACARFLANGGFPDDGPADFAQAWALAKLAAERANRGQIGELAKEAMTFIGTLSTRMEAEQFAAAGKRFKELEAADQARLAALAKREQEAKAAVEASGAKRQQTAPAGNDLPGGELPPPAGDSP